jgi:hypothetical protein
VIRRRPPDDEPIVISLVPRTPPYKNSSFSELSFSADVARFVFTRFLSSFLSEVAFPMFSWLPSGDNVPDSIPE